MSTTTIETSLCESSSAFTQRLSFTPKRFAFFSGVLAMGLFLGACSSSTPKESEAPSDGTELLEDEPTAQSENSSSSLEEAKAAIGKEDYEKAYKLLHVDLTRVSAEHIYYLALSEEMLMMQSDAESHYSEAIRRAPQLLEAYQNLSGLLYEKRDYDEMARVAKKGLEVAPGDAVLTRNLAIAHLSLKKYAEAESELIGLIGDSKDPILSLELAKAQVGQQKLVEAKKTLEVVKGSKDIAVLAEAARILGASKDLNGCIDYVSAAIEIEALPQLYMLKAGCYSSADKHKDAVKTYDQVIAIKPDLAAAYYFKAKSQIAAGDKNGAKKNLEKTIELAGKSDLAVSASDLLATL